MSGAVCAAADAALRLVVAISSAANSDVSLVSLIFMAILRWSGVYVPRERTPIARVGIHLTRRQPSHRQPHPPPAVASVLQQEALAAGSSLFA